MSRLDIWYFWVYVQFSNVPNQQSMSVILVYRTTVDKPTDPYNRAALYLKVEKLIGPRGFFLPPSLKISLPCGRRIANHHRCVRVCGLAPFYENFAAFCGQPSYSSNALSLCCPLSFLGLSSFCDKWDSGLRVSFGLNPRFDFE